MSREQEDPEQTAWMKAKIDEALNDPRPDIPAAKVFADLRAYMAARVREEDAEAARAARRERPKPLKY